ncbi:MAG: hypothetical protein U1D97_04635 [Desulfuromonadales bacterium]|nr:hypothetical protein [Desulfuromonadales bacterium]
MLVVMKKNASAAQIEGIKQYLIDLDYDFHQSTGANRVILGVIGRTDALATESLKELPGVLEVFKIPSDE